MKTILAAACLLFLATAARAQSQFFATSSTCTYSQVTVTTGTAVRIDNWNLGVNYLLNGRTGVSLSMPTGGQTIWWGFDKNVTNDSTKVQFGFEVLAAAFRDLPYSSAVPVYAIAASAAGAVGQRISVAQCAPKAYHVIP